MMFADCIRVAVTVPRWRHPGGVFYLQEGTVELSIQSASGSRSSKEQIVGGEIVGLTELFTGKKYKTSASCRSLAQVIFVSKEDLFR
jgi:CRP-like cAMP-binding protein